MQPRFAVEYIEIVCCKKKKLGLPKSLCYNNIDFKPFMFTIYILYNSIYKRYLMLCLSLSCGNSAKGLHGIQCSKYCFCYFCGAFMQHTCLCIPNIWSQKLRYAGLNAKTLLIMLLWHWAILFLLLLRCMKHQQRQQE